MRLRTAFILLGLLSVAACDFDLFGTDQRPIIAGYRVHAWEDGSYFLRAPADTSNVFNAPTIARIGWDRSRLVVQWAGRRHEPGAWAVIDLASGLTRGPLVADSVAADPALRHIRTFSADSAWRGLGHISPGA